MPLSSSPYSEVQRISGRHAMLLPSVVELTRTNVILLIVIRQLNCAKVSVGSGRNDSPQRSQSRLCRRPLCFVKTTNVVKHFRIGRPATLGSTQSPFTLIKGSPKLLSS